MKKLFFLLIGIALLSACCTLPGQGSKPAQASLDYMQTYVENVAETNGFEISPAVFDSLEAICQGSSVIVKATYLGYKEFSTIKNVYLFDVEDEFTNLITEKVIHIHESTETSFISGKTYYLFLNGFISSFYPYTVYSRYAPSCLIGEGENGYTFYGGQTMGLDVVDDISEYIRREIIDKGIVSKSTASLEFESVEDACDKAEVILIATALSVDDSIGSNPYIRFSEYSVERVLKGEPLYYEKMSIDSLSEEITEAAGLNHSNHPVMQSPADTKVGDKFILLFRIDPESQLLDMFSFQSSIFRIDSEQGRFILERFE